MMKTNDDLKTTDSRILREMADSLKADAKVLQSLDPVEARRLLRLFKLITAELHRRNNPATVHSMN